MGHAAIADAGLAALAQEVTWVLHNWQRSRRQPRIEISYTLPQHDFRGVILCDSELPPDIDALVDDEIALLQECLGLEGPALAQARAEIVRALGRAVQELLREQEDEARLIALLQRGQQLLEEQRLAGLPRALRCFDTAANIADQITIAERAAMIDELAQVTDDLHQALSRPPH